jgi:hypothetical protein
MRRKLVAISMLVVFLTLQYGKVATYLYCKWQAEVVQQLKECGCESHLAAIFTEKSPLTDSPEAIKSMAFEYHQQLRIAVPVFVADKDPDCFIDGDTPLTNRPVQPALRPPAC